MMLLARLVKADGRHMGTKSVPEDCLALRYGGATFVRIGSVMTDPVPSAVYKMTDTFHFNNLD